MKASFFSTLLVALAACSSHAGHSATHLQPALEPCAPLRPTPEDWRTFHIATFTPVTIRLPQNALFDSSAISFTIPDTGASGGSATVRIEAADPTRSPGSSTSIPLQVRDSLTYIDGVPVTPGPRGGVERECTLAVSGESSLVTFRRYHHWADSYSFVAVVPLPRGQKVSIFGEAPTWLLRDSLMLALPTIRIGAS